MRALRLGLRQVKGLAEADAERLVAGRPAAGYADPEALWRQSGLGAAVLERLAEADAFRSMRLDRRRALWALKAFGEPPLPLFATASHQEPSPPNGGRKKGEGGGGRHAPHPGPLAASAARESDAGGARDSAAEDEGKAAALLPEMPLGEHVIEDYRRLGLSLKRHPLAFLRRELAGEGLVTAADLAHLPKGSRVAIAGIVLIRQRPGSASGVVFVTIEDETGVANLIVWPKLLERYRRAVLGATLLGCAGELQREEGVIHIVADRLADRTPLLHTLRGRPGPAEPRRALVIASRDFR